jgi:malonyl CoA-acyl carrier protein transacylase/SAM-dependent methyltransferase
MQIALVNACQRAGVKPAAVIGHSSGEIAAAYAAGVLSMREAMVLAFYRGFVMNYKQPEGAMAAVGLGSQRVSQLLVHGVVVAAENSPESTTISGDIKAVESVMAMVKMRYPEVLVRRIHVDKAYHSHHMMPLAERYLGLVLDEGDIPTRAPEVNMFSTVTGQLHESPIPISYWAENLTSPVKFAAAASVLINAVPRTVLLEVGPHSQLAGPLRQITGPRFDYIPTLVRGKNCYQSLLTTFGKLFLRGVPLNFANIVPKGEVLTDLPPYPWDHGTSYWHESRPSQAWKNRKYGHHALLGQRIPESLDAEPSWRCILDLEDEPWLSDHIVKGTIIFPLAGYVAMAGEAVRQATGNNSGYLIKNIIAHSALILRPSQPVEVVTTFRRRKLNDTNGSDYFDFTISSCAGGHDVKHCDGQVKSLQFDGSAGPTPSPLSRKVSSKRWYEAMSQCGYNFGPAFCTLQNIEASPTDKCAVASVAAHDSARETPFALNPTVIDGCFQLLFVALTQGLTKRLEKTFLPTLIEEIRVRPHAGPVKVEAWSLDGGKTMSIKANSNGVAVFNLRGLHLTPLENDTSGDEDVHAACRVKWARLFEHMNLLPMLKPPLSVVSERIIIEEMTILAIIEHLHSVETIHVKIPYLEKYRDWLKRERQDIERNHSSLITNSSKFTAMSSGERRVQLEQRFQLIAKGSLFASKTGEAILRVCNRGADIFDGKIDTLQVLLEGGLLAEVYNSITFDFSPFIQNLSISRPGLRILEVGAGTGGTTAEIFKHILSPGSLPPFAEYMFTDISAGFFIAAKERFKHVLNMEYAVYDISQNPVQQGFKPETYDIILAANVVHTTASLHSTLSYLRELIRPGGYLLMTEVDTKSQMASYVFGNFSGWWMGENDARVHAPYVTVERWDSELKAAGFGGIKASARDCEDPYHYATAIVSQVPYLIADLPAVTILCGDNDNTIVRGLSNAFHHRSVAVSIIPFGQQQPRDTVVVTTMDVEGYFFQNISEDKFHQFQDFCRQYQSQQCLWLLRPSSLSTSDPRSAQSLGMLQIVRSELSIPVYTLEISPQEPQFVELVMEVIELIRRPDYSEKIAKDQEYIVEGGVIKIGRVETFSLTEEMRSLSPIALNDTATTLHIGTPGSLSTLGWVNQTLDPLDDLDVEVEAKSYGLNFKVEIREILPLKAEHIG